VVEGAQSDVVLPEAAHTPSDRETDPEAEERATHGRELRDGRAIPDARAAARTAEAALDDAVRRIRAHAANFLE
jgi:hypothetical protein